MLNFNDCGFLGYFNQCRLDKIVQSVKNSPTNIVDLSTACYNSGADPRSLTQSDIEYIQWRVNYDTI